MIDRERQTIRHLLIVKDRRGGTLADGEIILLLARCLQDLGVPNWQILLGEAELTRSLLAIFPPDVAPQVRHCLANLDLISLKNLNLSDKLQERALFLFDLRGKPETILEKVASLDLEPSARAIVNNLKSLITLINESSAIPIPMTLDLSLLKTFDYYTGIVFEAISFTDDRSYVLGQGGRYDQLLKLYDPQGKASPGIGFSFNIEELHSSLLATKQLPQETPASDWLVIPKSVEASVAAVQYADSLRQSQPGIRVELDLGDRSTEAVREYATSCRIKNLAWIAADGTVIEESL